MTDDSLSNLYFTEADRPTSVGLEKKGKKNQASLVTTAGKQPHPHEGKQASDSRLCSIFLSELGSTSHMCFSITRETVKADNRGEHVSPFTEQVCVNELC